MADEGLSPKGPPLRQRQQRAGGPNNKKRRAPLSPDEAAAFVHARAAVNGPERVNLKGRDLDGPAAVRAVCDAIISLQQRDLPYPAVTTTLNLVSNISSLLSLLAIPSPPPPLALLSRVCLFITHRRAPPTP